jgi:hypothetical protein
MSEREALVMPAFEDALDDFAPRRVSPGIPAKRAGQGAALDMSGLIKDRTSDARRAVDAVSQFPSREASFDGQLNLKGPQHVLDRFKALCKSDRRAYYDMLTILMDRYEE